MKFREGFIETKEGKVWYKIFNEESANAPLLILHGGPGSSSHSLQTLSSLASTRPVVFYDQLGCGKSDRPDKKALWNKDFFVEELETVRKHFSFDQLYLLGHSWGSMLAVLYALRYPNHVERLVLSGPFLSEPHWTKDTNRLKKNLPQEIQDIIEKNERAGTFDSKEYEAATTEFYKRYFCRIYPYPEVIQEAFKQTGTIVYNTMWGPTEFTCLGNLKGVDLTKKLKLISLPVLLVCGEYDTATPKTTELYKNVLPNAEMRVIKDAAHAMFIEKKEEYLELVKDFLNR